MFVPTRSSQLKSITADSCETIVYSTKSDDRTRCHAENEVVLEKPLIRSQPQKPKTPKKPDNKWSMKKLRYDIIKFGTTGFRGAKKEESKIALAVSLGAEPPKKEYINYKKLIQVRKAEKTEAAKLKNQNGNRCLKKTKAKGNTNKKKGAKR